MKEKFFGIDSIKKQIYRKENPIKKQETVCSICGFLLNVDNVGWFEFIVKCKHLFLRNINSSNDLEKIDIETEEKYMDILYRLIEYYPLFEKAIEGVDICDEFRRFLAEDLNDCCPTIKDLREDIYHISGPPKNFLLKKLFSEKLFAFLYSTMVGFCKTNKVQGISISKKFIDNLLGILNNSYQLHHSHITGKIIGFADSYCNQKVRENYFKIPVVPHNLFRFDFFFLLNGLRSGMWRMIDIKIGGKKPTDINLASIGNQV